MAWLHLLPFVISVLIALPGFALWNSRRVPEKQKALVEFWLCFLLPVVLAAEPIVLEHWFGGVHWGTFFLLKLPSLLILFQWMQFLVLPFPIQRADFQLDPYICISRALLCATTLSSASALPFIYIVSCADLLDFLVREIPFCFLVVSTFVFSTRGNLYEVWFANIGGVALSVAHLVACCCPLYWEVPWALVLAVLILPLCVALAAKTTARSCKWKEQGFQRWDIGIAKPLIICIALGLTFFLQNDAALPPFPIVNLDALHYFDATHRNISLVMWGWSFHHGALNVSLPGHEVGISLKQHLPLLITAPNPLWPNITTSTGSAVQQRADFWLSLMCLKYMFSVVLAVALLSWWPWAKKPASDYDSGQVEEIEEELEAFLLIDASNPNDSSDDDCHYDSARLEGEDTAVPAKDVRMATMAVTVAQLMLVTGTTMRATAVDRLTFSNGLCWEAYDLCFTAGLLWYLLQVIALRAIKPSAVFLTVDVAVSSLAFLPFLGDPFDTLKDSILAALAINAGVTMKWQWLSVLGFCGVAYLWLLHSWMLRDPEMEKELQASYVSVLLLKPKAEGGRLAWRPSISQQIWGFLCQQTKSDKQKMLLVEDGPQALLAGAMAFAGALRPVIAWLNLILPSIRLAGSFFLHDYFARKAVPCLFYEAYRNQIAGQTELCQQKVDVLVRICRKELIDFESSWSSKLARIPKELLREVLKDLGFSHHDALPATWPVLKGRWPERDPPPLTCFLTFMIGAQDVDIASCNMHPGVIRDSELYDEFIVRLVRLKGLQELKIRCQDAAHCQRIMVLASAVALVELDLINFADAYWSIGALGAKAVADALVTNETLQKINMAHHDIGPSGATRLANALLANQTLQRLSLGYNGIEDEGCEAFAKMLATNQTLLELYLPVNDIGPTGACALAEALVRNQGLQVLSLSGNEIKDEGAKALAGALVTNTTLQKLYLRKAGLGPAGVASLAKVLASNPSLEVEKGDSDAETRVNDLVDKSNSELYLWANGFGGAGAASLADASATNQTLRNLTLTCDWSGFFPQEDRQIR